MYKQWLYDRTSIYINLKFFYFLLSNVIIIAKLKNKWNIQKNSRKRCAAIGNNPLAKPKNKNWTDLLWLIKGYADSKMLLNYL